MKLFVNFKIVGKVLVGLIIMLFSTLFFACNKNDIKKQEASENDKINSLKIKYGMNESNAIGSGVYLKFTNSDRDSTNLKPVNGNMVITTFTGELSTGSIFDATDSAIAAENNIIKPFYVFGPARLFVGSSVEGINLALKKMVEKDDAIILIPSSMAWHDYEPVVYKMHLYRIIQNDTTYEQVQMQLYADSLKHYGLGDFSAPDSTNIRTWIRNAPVSTTDTVKVGDSLTVDLRAYFVEVESFLKGPRGRIYFPRENYSSRMTYIYGDADYFPRTWAIDQTVGKMFQGETREIIAGFENVYGAVGYLHPLLYYIVPPYMPVHYIITLVKRKTNN
jgi:hypothetical protein